MVLIYTTYITIRLRYAVDTLFEQVTNVPFQLTDDLNFYRQSNVNCRINYSLAKISDNEFWIQPHRLLFENNIQQHTIECFEWSNLKAFFKTEGDLAFDIFAASFYLITRYEEYLPHTLDEYGRYAHTNSLAFKENFLHSPLVNLWMKAFIKKLKQKFSLFTIYYSPFAFLPTYDIDIAYAYKGKGLQRNTGGLFKDLISFKINKLVERILVLCSFKKDPFDTYEWLNTLHTKHKLRPVYFYLLAERNYAYDKNIDPKSNEIKQLILNNCNKKYYSGIHPSWQSGNNAGILKKEILLFEKIIGKHVNKSRQHYIRLTFPETYRRLTEHGIKHEYSMGYGSINGFRASVASPFYWYDLQQNERTDLTVHPFCYMEANSFFEQHYTAQQAGEELQQYHDTVKSVNGKLITIFHNHFVTEQKEWIEWRNMYADFLKQNF